MDDGLGKKLLQILSFLLLGGVAAVIYTMVVGLKSCWITGYIQDKMYVLALLRLQDEVNQNILLGLAIGLLIGLFFQYLLLIMRRLGKAFLTINIFMSNFLSKRAIIKIALIFIIISLLILNATPLLMRYTKGCSHHQDPNIILITVDALRADHLSCYGYSRHTTPHIDNLAQRGIIFKNAVVSAPVTLPSLPRMMTSNIHTGITISKQERTLPEILQNEGYITAAIVRNPPIEMRCEGGSLRSGFDYFICPDNLGKGIIRQIYEADWQAENITNEAILWLRHHPNKKFFLWLHYFDPHDPYSPPHPYDSRFTSPDYRGPFDGDIRKTEENKVKVFGDECAPLNSEDREHIIALYDGEVNYVDDQIGRFLHAVKDMGYDKDSIIVLSADHGESLGEHGIWTHGYSVYDQEVMVPLIIAGPLLAHHVVTWQVELLDVAPTILELVHCPVAGSMEGGNLLDFSGANGSSHERYAFIQYGQIFALRSQSAKLIDKLHSERIKEFYDLTSDPGETENIYEKEGARVRKLEKALKQRFYKDADLKYDTEIMEKLRALGYLQ